MPSLLSRFLGKKKNADKSPLLDGEKFEAVPRTTSPSAPTFGESAHRTKSKEKEQGKAQGKRSKRSSAGLYDTQLAESVPILSLSLPDAKGEEKKSQGLGVVFEGITDGTKILDDEALGEKRLSPSETLVLVQKTSEVLTERGLETLGVMRPHWFASPRQQEIQLKLIHRFLETQGTQNSNAAPSSPTSESTFESDLRYSRDPHDVAAVLRWGLRHLQLEGNSFGASDSTDWYRVFADSERSGSYPIKAFDDLLVPLLPATHTNLLRATLDLVSSLAAHSEENGISGNKLSKVLGWWVVSSRNIQGAKWPEFYAQWEAAARQFEHLFLVYIRAQDAQSRMPKRLTELVKNYPFAKSRRDEDGIYLPRSRFSTRSADALFVQVTVDKSAFSSRPHPLRIVEDAFRAIAESETTGPYVALWEEIRKVASQPGNRSREEGEDEADHTLNLSTILADESIRLFSLVPTPDGNAAPTISLFTPLPAGRGRRSLSVGDRSPTTPTANGQPQRSPRESSSHSKAATSPQNSSQGHNVTPDWQAFSSSGFDSPSGLSLAASLWDNDTEVSQPTAKKTLGKRGVSRTESSRRRSADLPTSTGSPIDSTKPARRTYNAPRMVTLDEAFIDFWADSLLDSVARTWPSFVLCQLKPLPTFKRTEDSKPIEWLVIERVAAEPARPVPPPLKTSSASARAASPLPSPTTSDSKSNRWTSSTLSATRKRWSFFSSKTESAPALQGGKDRTAKKAAKEAKVGEMGEILREEDESVPNGVKANGKAKIETPKKSSEKPQPALQPPAIQVNGVAKSEEPTTAATASAPQDPALSPAPGLSPIEEDSANQIAEHASQDNVESSQPPAVVEEAREFSTPIEIPAVTLAPAAPVSVTTEVPPTKEENSLPAEAAPSESKPLIPEPQVAASTVEKAPSPPVEEPITVVKPVEEVRAPSPEAVKAVQPEHEFEAAQHTPTVTSVPETVEPQADPPAASSSVEESGSVGATEPSVEASPETVQQPESQADAYAPTGPYVHHATIYIPPADEADIAQAEAALAEHDTSPPSPESPVGSHTPQTPSESEPRHSVQEPATVGQELAAVPEDATKPDEDVRQEAPAEETRPEEHSSQATP